MLISAGFGKRTFRERIAELWFWTKTIPSYLYFLYYVTFRWGKGRKRKRL